ncbi:Sodium/calcium exchanger NCL-like protein [Drosera capensis]
MSSPSLLSLLLLFLTLTLSPLAAAARATPPLISDGVTDHLGHHVPSFLRLNTIFSSSDTCDETYGFMPCTTTWLGNLFLILVYGYLMYTGATFLSNGSELLLEVMGPGIVGGLFLPVLGALPDAMLILVSGLSGSTDTAQSQVSVGMGLLAGSTVMLLTVIWGTCVIVGKCDIQNSTAIDNTDTKGFKLTESGVSTDIWTSYAARIMAVSVIPFIVVQLPQVLSSTSARRIAILVGLILSLVLLITYCLYQVFQPWIQKRKVSYVKTKKIMSEFIHQLKKRAFAKLLTQDGMINEHVIEKIFHALDTDKDNQLSASELRSFVIGMRLDELKLDEDDVVEKVMKEFDTDPDCQISLDEFKAGISRWIDTLKGLRPKSVGVHPDTMKYIADLHEESQREHELLGYEDVVSEENGEENSKNPVLKAVLLLALGTIIAAVFADPLVDAVDNFSDATGIPSFFISFIFLPLATNSSEAVSAIIFASRKRKRTASLTFSELYGAVTMNNLLCLAVFLALVYVRDLTWDFSAEVLIILLVCVVMGVLGSFRTGFPLWTAIIAFALYPFSLLLVYILDYICGWS